MQLHKATRLGNMPAHTDGVPRSAQTHGQLVFEERKVRSLHGPLYLPDPQSTDDDVVVPLIDAEAQKDVQQAAEKVASRASSLVKAGDPLRAAPLYGLVADRLAEVSLVQQAATAKSNEGVCYLRAAKAAAVGLNPEQAEGLASEAAEIFSKAQSWAAAAKDYSLVAYILSKTAEAKAMEKLYEAGDAGLSFLGDKATEFNLDKYLGEQVEADGQDKAPDVIQTVGDEDDTGDGDEDDTGGGGGMLLLGAAAIGLLLMRR